jgi:hypothetical protein
MLNNINCTFVERKWMRAAKAWRCFIELPDTPQLAAVLTAYIESQVAVDISAPGFSITMDPMIIVDVPSKRKKFQIVVETVYEKQAGHGKDLTEITDTPITMTIRPTGTEKPEPVFKAPRGTITKESITFLHTGFFKSDRFKDYIIARTGAYVKTDLECKNAFKVMMKVGSCSEIDQIAFDVMLQDLNEWGGKKRV